MALQVPLPLQRLVAGRGRGGPIDSRRLGSRDGGMGGGVPVSGPLTRLSALETGTKPWSCDDWLQAVVSGAEELPKEDATQSPSGKEGVHSNHRRPISSRRGFTPQRVLAAGCWLEQLTLEQLPRYARLKIHPGKMPSPFWFC